MKNIKIIMFGILTFFIGFLIMFFIGGIFSQPGGGQLTSSVFNSGIMALICCVLFLCSIIVICTLFIVKAINSKNPT